MLDVVCDVQLPRAMVQQTQHFSIVSILHKPIRVTISGITTDIIDECHASLDGGGADEALLKL